MKKVLKIMWLLPWTLVHEPSINKYAQSRMDSRKVTGQTGDGRSARLRHSHTPLWLRPTLRFPCTELFVQTKDFILQGSDIESIT